MSVGIINLVYTLLKIVTSTILNILFPVLLFLPIFTHNNKVIIEQK